MTDILPIIDASRCAPASPGTHALVIGVSQYLYFRGGPNACAKGEEWNLDQLSAAAASAAKIAEWLLCGYNNPSAPLRSLRLLLSPSERELLPARIATALNYSNGVMPPEHRAMRNNVENALKSFKNACEASRDNVAFVYACGHGVRLTDRESIVLLSDAAAPNSLNPLDGAIDMYSCYSGLTHGRAASKQFWFVDACRHPPEIAYRFEKMKGALELSVEPGSADSAPYFLSAAPGQSAFARQGQQSLFCEAFLECVNKSALEGPNEHCAHWHVAIPKLADQLCRRVRQLAHSESVTQDVYPTGRMSPCEMHLLPTPPTVPIRVQLEPTAACAVSSAEIATAQRQVIASVACAAWPLQATVNPGIYELNVNTQQPYKTVRDFVRVEPPLCHHEVRV